MLLTDNSNSSPNFVVYTCQDGTWEYCKPHTGTSFIFPILINNICTSRWENLKAYLEQCGQRSTLELEGNENQVYIIGVNEIVKLVSIGQRAYYCLRFSWQFVFIRTVVFCN